ncbi:MAG: hypothetical protein EA357_03465 [Micavibrio sp.]|nr:MAG: hypothetical protein EA357_03465 [Micavibrio sp.]
MSKYVKEKDGKAGQTPESHLTTEQWQKLDEQFSMVELCSGADAEGRSYWAYLSLYPSRYREFRENAAGGVSMRLTDYGEVLATGWGPMPPALIKAKMEEKYGLNHQNPLEKEIEYRLEEIRKGV